jgi:hypothetical protein
LYQSQGETQLALRVAEGYKRLLDESRMHFARCSAVADIEHARELTAQAKAQAKAQDQHDMCLLTEVGDAVLERARADMRADAWQDYALAYEVLCEAAAEHDAVGAANASQAVANARRVLEALGQYSA